jgi:hypothetical protein
MRPEKMAQNLISISTIVILHSEFGVFSPEFGLNLYSESLTLNFDLIKRRDGYGKNACMGNKDGCGLSSG